MPPLPKRLFGSIEMVIRMTAAKQGRVLPTSYGYLLSVTLGSRQLYSATYVRELLKSTTILSRDTVERFNDSRKGRQAIEKAKEEFRTQLTARTPYSDPKRPGLATPKLLAATFMTEPATIVAWCQGSVLPHRTIDERHYFDPTELLEYFTWSQ